MSTTAPHAPGEHGEPAARPRAASASTSTGYRYALKGVKALASLRLTVVLFSLAIVLVFFGTLAQLELGIWTVVEKYFYSWVVMIPTELIHRFLGVFWKETFPPGQSAWTTSFPFPAGKLIGWLMVINLLAAHALRFRLTWKRSGVFLIHGGLLLLFAGEFITREYAVEQRMTIDEGQSVNYTQDSRFVELAFVDKSGPKSDVVVAIPESMLKQKGRISHPDLPVDVEVVGDFMINSALERPGEQNTADTGMGRMWSAKRIKEVSGLDENKINLPAVYVKLYKKGTDQSLGTYLTALLLTFRGAEEQVQAEGKTYDMSLRFKRYYKPYRVHLDKFKAERYMGTKKAKEYYSDVRIYDDAGNLVRQQRIAMNEPLRYAGETFYQGGFDEATEKTTILQVVKNPGWLLPYVSCAVVGVGLTLHFLIYLLQFLKTGAVPRPRAESAVAADAAPAPAAPLPRAVRLFPWAMVALSAVYLLGVVGRMGPPSEPPGLDAFARLPVVEGGRVKPLDTVARVKLRIISGKEEFTDKNGDKQPAIRWYLDVISSGDARRGAAWEAKVFRIDNEMLLGALKLDKREGFRYSMDEIAPSIDVIRKRMDAIQEKVDAGQKLDTDDSKFKELRDRIQTFMELGEFGGLLLLPPREPGEDWSSLREARTVAMQESVRAGLAAARVKVAPKVDPKTGTFSEEDEAKIHRYLGINPAELKPDARKKTRDRVLELLRADPEKMPEPEARKMWLDVAFVLMTPEEERAIRTLMRTQLENRLAAFPAARAWERMAAAHRDKKPNEFAAAMDEYRKAALPNLAEKDLNRAKAELFLNRFAPFYQCTGLYVLAFVLSVVGFSQHAAQRPHWGNALRRGATLVLLLTFVLHTLALFGRMYVMNRWGVFVTNLYASAVFIGWGCVGLGLALERIFPLGVGNVLAAMLGLATCIVAHNLATDDTMEMVVAVLDTNFWLATHVTTVTLGYTATFVAGFLGALYVFQMLGAVVRDSYQSTGEPTVGQLLAFGAAATGVVGIPLFFLWFMTSAMDKYEVFPSTLLWLCYWLVFGIGLMYAVGLMLLRVATEGVDAQGRPLAGRTPGLAAPVVALALTPERSKVFGQMVYGVVCFATLLSFVGTVLGGIWADQSWGRFWGWDPKENGAVLIVLWNSLILHARWCGLVKDRGVAVLAIFGNVITAWSWFGTNQLSIGLHAYGFDSRLADGCFNFWISQMFILGWGLIPKQFWASATRRPGSGPAPTGEAAQAPAPAPAETGAQANAAPPASNGQPRRDKGKRSGKRR